MHMCELQNRSTHCKKLLSFSVYMLCCYANVILMCQIIHSWDIDSTGGGGEVMFSHSTNPNLVQNMGS